MERIRVAPLDELPDGRGVQVDAAGHRIALFRIGGEVFALGDRCSHAEASLAEGPLVGAAVECPRHGSEFDLRTGRPGSFPATAPVPVYGTEVAGGDVFLLIDTSGEDAR